MALSKGDEKTNTDTPPDAPAMEPTEVMEVKEEVDGVVVATNRPDVPVAASLATGPGEHKPAVPVDDDGMPVEK